MLHSIRLAWRTKTVSLDLAFNGTKRPGSVRPGVGIDVLLGRFSVATLRAEGDGLVSYTLLECEGGLCTDELRFKVLGSMAVSISPSFNAHALTQCKSPVERDRRVWPNQIDFRSLIADGSTTSGGKLINESAHAAP